MKNLYLLALLLFSAVVPAQQDLSTDAIAEAEMKAAANLQHLAVNPNTLNYDVTYHKLDLTVNPSAYFISGVVTTTYTALSMMTSITFDFTNELTVSSVTRNGTSLGFTQNANNELVISLGTFQPAGTSSTLVITYSGEPGTDNDAFAIGTHAGTPVLWTLSEPYGARDWWPCKQDLNDKIDNIEVRITAPSQYTAVSNGLQTSVVTNGANKTTVWQHSYPIPAYLVAIAVTNYSVFTQTAGTAPNEFPIINYYYPENFAAVPQLAQTLPIMDLFESLFDTYPFANEKYGHAQCGFGGGMEHTTISFMGSFGRNLIAHELGHQWFGDKVTCGTWNDIWLNEGFATYLSGLVVEHLDGPEEFVDWKNGLINNITSQPGGSLYVPESQLNNVGRIFSSRLSYNKGAMVVEMLRWKLGDENFYQGLRNYLNDPALAYDFAVTADLQSHLEAVSGIDLDEFFADWIYGEGYPTYHITAQNVGQQVQFTIDQEQSHPSVSFFEMPLPVRVFGANGEQADLVLQNTADLQIITLPAPFPVVAFEFDPDLHILSADNTATLGVPGHSFDAIKIYPNPAADELTISMPEANFLKARIYNSIGQLVLESDAMTIPVGALASGVHFIRIETTEGNLNRKFIKR